MRDFIGTLRIYSLLDLILFLLIFNLNIVQTLGFVLVHIGFLFFLEYQHQYSYRKSFHWSIWLSFYVIGVALSGEYLATILFIVLGYVYTKKDKKYFAFFSPTLRGLQYYVVAAFLTSPSSLISILALILIFMRNILGDFRDVEKDIKKEMKTIPILIGLKKNWKNIHLIGVISTTFIWSQFTDISILVLLLVVVVQVLTYDITKR